MTREEAQEAWVKVNEIGFSDYSKLTRKQRVWFNLEPLCMGGLWDLYMNHHADRIEDIIEDLEYLDFSFVANQLRTFNQAYFPRGVPKGPDSRRAQLDQFPEEQITQAIESLDAEFWKKSRELESALIDHIHQTGIGIV
jgi:hypothetical protein